MVANFKEICVRGYHFLLSRYFPETSKGRNFIKGCVYSISLFWAKRNGFLPFFFSNKEKIFNCISTTKQYKIGLENTPTLSLQSSQLNKDDHPKANITIIFFTNESKKHLEQSLNSIYSQTHNNFDLIIIGGETESKLLENSLTDKTIKHVKVIPIRQNSNVVNILNKIISDTITEYITFLDNTGIIQLDAIQQTLTIAEKEKFDIIYADEDVIELNNTRTNPFFKPNWSPYLSISKFYVGKFIIYKTNLLKSIKGFDDSLPKCNEFDLFLRASEKSSKIYRLPKILFSNFANTSKDFNAYKTAVLKQLQRKKIPAIVEITSDGNCKLIPKLENIPLVSIIIPTKDNLNKLKKCLDSISKSTYKNYEIVIVSNSKKEKTWKFLYACGHKILQYNEPFNFSKINNFATKNVNGDYLVFLNDDTEVITNEWLESMLLYSIQKDVGVVGSLLLFPRSPFYRSSIQHGGVLIGIAGPTNHSFGYCNFKEKNYHDFDKVVRNVSAVTAACMMVRKDVFDKMNGFDENFTISFGDIDFCLRCRQLGYQIIYNPNVMLYHYESSTRGVTSPLNDDIAFRTRWEDYIILGDEFYNPNLSHLARNFRINPYFSHEPALALLFEIYFFRIDLQRLFPDAKNNIIMLIDWAATKGVSSDFCRIVLLPYNKYYRDNCSDKVKEIVEPIYLFNNDIKLQLKFSEVFAGKYENLLSYFNTNFKP
jgi:GT2 family glycosyltransferase